MYIPDGRQLFFKYQSILWFLHRQHMISEAAVFISIKIEKEERAWNGLMDPRLEEADVTSAHILLAHCI